MTIQTDTAQAPPALSPRDWLRLVFTYLLIPLVLMLAAWDFRWWQAWVFAVFILAAGIVSRLLAERRHPGLLAERASSGTAENAKSWDRILAPLMALSTSFPIVIVAGLDHRFGWSPAFPLWLSRLGLVLIALGYALGSWALIENRFFSGTVRIQTERGHSVCDTGPYRLMRHPGYAGNVIPLPGFILAFSSVWTAIPAIIGLVIVVARTALEDKTLQEELPGYRDYARRTRYRLIPGLW